MNLQSNMQLMRGEWRAVRRASMKLMHHSLSMVGLLAVGMSALLFTHPDHARTVGKWLTISHAHATDSTGDGGELSAARDHASLSASLPLVGRIADRTEEASRLLGLMNRDLSPTQDEGPVTLRRISNDAADDGGPALTKEEREVSRYISRKYRVNNDAIALVVDAAYVTGKELSIDPVLLLAVMAVESGFNPFAQSTAGASGLMQLMSSVHRDKLADFGGANIALNPVANVRVGAVVLKDCIRRGGSVADGLRLYVGAGSGDDSGYGARVLQERDRILQAARGIVRPRVAPLPAASAKAGSPARAADAHEADDKAETDKV